MSNDSLNCSSEFANSIATRAIEDIAVARLESTY
jgi:hypothetical protein